MSILIDCYRNLFSPLENQLIMSNIMRIYSRVIKEYFLFLSWWSYQQVQLQQISQIFLNKPSPQIYFFYFFALFYLVLLFFLNLTFFIFPAIHNHSHFSYFFTMIFSSLYFLDCLLLYLSLYVHQYDLQDLISFIIMSQVLGDKLQGYLQLIVSIPLMQVYLSICLPLTASFKQLNQIFERLQKEIQCLKQIIQMSLDNKNKVGSGTKKKDGEQSQLQQISSHSSSRNQVREANLHEEQHETQLQQTNKEIEHLNSNASSHSLPADLGRSDNINFIARLLNNRGKIIKWVMVISILLFALWFGSRFLTQSLSRKRHPMFLSSFNPSKASQVMSPLQSDYISFKYYVKMLNLTQFLVKQKREPTDQQMKQFEGIKFKQFLNAYKVILAIQLSKQYNKTKEQEQEQSQQLQQKNLQQAVNKTQYFFDAVNQFQCSSCYSFPITATIQYLYKYRYNISIKLSQQQLIDCAHDKQQQNGCQEGNITKGFQYSRDVGLVSTEQYPYRSITGTSYKCDLQTLNSTNVKKYKISGFKILPPGSCQAIQSELIKGNVVAAMINAGDLSTYTEGVFTDCKRYGLNHAITIVGQTQKNEWIVRNSWGKNWGNNGYFVMGHGNSCGVCSHAIVPILKISEDGTVIPYNQKQDQTKKQTK